MKRDLVGDGPANHQECNRYVDSEASPTSLFEQFLDDKVIDELIEKMTKYARISKGRTSFGTTREEFRAYLSVLFISGYNQLPRRRMYWERADDVLNLAISGAMTCNRFEELLMCVHVADNANLPPNDRMAKVRPLFNSVNERFLAARLYDHHLSIDESMVPYYGRHSSKQFIRGKPIRFGFKVWSLNTAFGYCIQMDIRVLPSLQLNLD